MAGAFPGSALHARDLLAGDPTRHRTWFDLSLLTFASTMRKHNAHIAMDSLTSSLFDMHLSNLGRTLASQRVVREQFGKTVEEPLGSINSSLFDKSSPDYLTGLWIECKTAF